MVRKMFVDVEAKREETKRIIDARAKREWNKHKYDIPRKNLLNKKIRNLVEDIGMKIPKNKNVCVCLNDNDDLSIITGDSHMYDPEIMEFRSRVINDRGFGTSPKDHIKNRCSGVFIKA